MCFIVYYAEFTARVSLSVTGTTLFFFFFCYFVVVPLQGRRHHDGGSRGKGGDGSQDSAASGLVLFLVCVVWSSTAALLCAAFSRLSLPFLRSAPLSCCISPLFSFFFSVWLNLSHFFVFSLAPAPSSVIVPSLVFVPFLLLLSCAFLYRTFFPDFSVLVLYAVSSFFNVVHLFLDVMTPLFSPYLSVMHSSSLSSSLLSILPLCPLLCYASFLFVLFSVIDPSSLSSSLSCIPSIPAPFRLFIFSPSNLLLWERDADIIVIHVRIKSPCRLRPATGD